jgi:MFS family permease
MVFVHYTNRRAKVYKCVGFKSPLTPTLSPLDKGGEGREWGDSARAAICELCPRDWYYLDRNNLAIVLPQIAREFGWDDRQIGQYGNLLLGAFYVTFGVAQVILSPLAERWGVKRSLMASVVGFLVCTMLFYPLGGSLGALIVLRLLLGAAESVHMPMNSALVGRWFALHERGRANSVYVAGILVALAVAPLIVVPLEERFGWRATFLLLAQQGWQSACRWWRATSATSRLTGSRRRRRGCACALPTLCGHTARTTRWRSGYTWWRGCATPSACSAS